MKLVNKQLRIMNDEFENFVCNSLMNKLTNLNFFLIWVLVFLFSNHLIYLKAFVFEWLEWNGTNKNDWFFVLWWGLVVVWFFKWFNFFVSKTINNENKNNYIQKKPLLMR